MEKFDNLSNKPLRFDARWVTNLSNRQLSSDESSVLSKGLGFATSHFENDKLHFIASLEPIISNLKDVSSEEKKIFREKI